MGKKQEKTNEEKPKRMKVVIKRLDDTYEVEVLENEKIQEVANVMAKELEKPVGDLIFIYGGKPLKNGDFLKDLNIKNGSPIYLAIKQDKPRGPTGLLPPDDAGEHGKTLAEAFETIIDEIPNIFLALFNSHQKTKEILEDNPKLVKSITNIPKVIKHIIVHPTITSDDLAKEFPENNDPEVLKAGSKMIEIVLTDEAFNTEPLEFIKLWNQNAEIDEEKILKICGNPFWKMFLKLPFITEFIINFLPNQEPLFQPEDRRKIFKLLVQNPQQGLEERKKCIAANKSASNDKKRKPDDKPDDKSDGNDTSTKFAKKDGQSSVSDASAEVKYKKDLEMLKKMGFTDHAANVKALEDANGDYDDAVDLLIQRGH